MMRKSAFFWLALMLTVCFFATAFAAEDTVVLKMDGNFSIFGMNAREDGTFLIAGALGDNPRIAAYSAAGELLWAAEQDGREGYGFYRDAVWLDGDTVVAVRAPEDLESQAFALEYLENGGIVRRAGSIDDPRGLYPLPDGFLIGSAPEFYTARVEKRSPEGEVLWQIDWDEWLSFNGIVTRGDVHVAFGKKTVRDGDIEHFIGVAIAFDDRGEILWRIDGDDSHEFVDAAFTDGGNVVLVDEMFIAEYAAGEEVWRRDYLSQTVEWEGTSTSIGRMNSILPVQGGYLISVHAGLIPGMQMRLIDTRGSVVKEWIETLEGLGINRGCKLFRMNDAVYLLAYGKIESESIRDWGWEDTGTTIAELPEIVIAKGIDFEG